MLTIRAMVRFGPWTLNDIERVDELEHCHRCNASIREVWVCEIESSHERSAELGDQTIWRIGNECGPALMQVSDEVWKHQTSPVRSRIRYAKRLEVLLKKASDARYELPAFVEERRVALLNGTLDERLLRHLGLVMTHHERQLGLRKT